MVGAVRREEEEDEGGAERRSIEGDAEEAGLRADVEDRVGSGAGVEEAGVYRQWRLKLSQSLTHDAEGRERTLGLTEDEEPDSRVSGSGGGPSIAHRFNSYLLRMKLSILLFSSQWVSV